LIRRCCYVFLQQMATISTDELREMFNDLKKSIKVFYLENAEQVTDGTLKFEAVMKNCDKLELFIDGDYKQLWFMEQEERRRLARQLESIPIQTAKLQEISEVQRRDSYTSMPPLETILHENITETTFDDMPHLCSCRGSCLVEEANEIIETNSPSQFITPTPVQAPSATPTFSQIPSLINLYPGIAARSWLPQNNWISSHSTLLPRSA